MTTLGKWIVTRKSQSYTLKNTDGEILIEKVFDQYKISGGSIDWEIIDLLSLDVANKILKSYGAPSIIQIEGAFPVKTEKVILDKYTYGKTPAALYLADALNRLNAPKLARKVTRTMTNFNRIFNELETANQAGIMSVHTIGGLAALMKTRIEATKFELSDLPDDCSQTDEVLSTLTLVNDLTRNLLTGRTRDIARRVQKVRIFEQQNVTSQSAPTKPLSEVEDVITPELLTERSLQKLTRLNKVSTLY